MMFRLLLICLLTLGASWAKSPIGGGNKSINLKVVTTNFENHFDHLHDAGKEDFTYLPLVVKRTLPEALAWCENQTGYYRESCFNLDWTEEVFERKSQRIAEVMNGVFFPSQPDVIVVQEVENMNALESVARKLGPKYRAVLIEGPDERGIDTGVITRLNVLSSQLHSFNTVSGRPTRGILEVVVQAGNYKVTVLANHWPSQNNPDGNRMNAGEKLLQAAKAAQKRSDLVIAAGDFNTSSDDELNALETYVYPNFLDAESSARRLGVKFEAQASYSHRGVWASLDHIFLMKGSRLTRKVDFSQVSLYTEQGKLIENYVFQGRNESRPVRYDHETGEGYSDHLPLAMTIKL